MPCLYSDDLPLPVAVSLHPPVPALSSRRPQRSFTIYSGCGFPLLRPLRPPARCCLRGSGHQHYLPVRCALIPMSVTACFVDVQIFMLNSSNTFFYLFFLDYFSASCYFQLTAIAALCVTGLMKRDTATGKTSQRSPARVSLIH